MVGAVAGSRGWRILNLGSDKESQLVHLTPGTSISAAPGYFGLAVLLRDHDVDIVISGTDLEVRWSPHQILCYSGTAFKARNDKIRITCLVMVFDISEN